jgi:polyribonucleotide nucleotidyltransferase
MFTNTPVTHEMKLGDTTITLQTGLLANQANASVLAKMGETTVLAAVVVGKETQTDYFPLQVVYEERLYASGKIKGSRFIKREGRPTENAVLAGRMIDRSIRSLFDGDLRTEVQIIITVLSVDEVNPPDVLAVLAASSALKLAVKDFKHLVSSVRVGLINQDPKIVLIEKTLSQIHIDREVLIETKDFTDDVYTLVADVCKVLDISNADDKVSFRKVFTLLNDIAPELAEKLKSFYATNVRDNSAEILLGYLESGTFVVAPTYLQVSESPLDLVVSGDGNSIVMVEAGADIIDEETISNALDTTQPVLAQLTAFQSEFVSKVEVLFGDRQVQLKQIQIDDVYFDVWNNLTSEIETALYNVQNKDQRKEKLATVLKDQLEILEKESDDTGTFIKQKDLYTKAFFVTVKKLVHSNILLNDKRIDGRALNQTRDVSCQIDVLPRTHGSSLFNRGETQVLNILTLGTMRDAQTLDDMEDFDEVTKRYIHHYNFPSYSVGETGRYYGPGRREIGHGALAEKALLPVLPTEDEFPYTMRLVSECLGSNGSTSMASTCGSCLSLMAGGVPIKDMVGGVAMGLVLNSQTGEFKVLTDILGDEDHYGDMDFKVTGTKTGITAIQLDNKVAGLTVDILKKALIQAREGRLHILEVMSSVISKPVQNISQFAPSVLTTVIPFEKIGDVIGPSGKIIKSIIAEYGVEIDIEDATGRTFIYGKDSAKSKACLEYILQLTKEYKPGDAIVGKVFRVENYGAFLKIDGTDKEGMLHISQFKTKEKDVTQLVKMGEVMNLKVFGVNEKGQISLMY